MRRQGVLQTAADKPAVVIVRFFGSGPVETCAGRIHVMQSGLVRDVAKCAATGEVGQPVSDRITDATSERGEVVGVESLLNALVTGSRHDERARVEGIACPQVAAIAFNAEYPATALEVEANHSACFTAISVEIVGGMCPN